MAKFPVIDRWTAYQRENTRFYTGKRCRFGHLSERYVTSGNCVECDKRRSTRNQQKYRAKMKAEATAKKYPRNGKRP